MRQNGKISSLRNVTKVTIFLFTTALAWPGVGHAVGALAVGQTNSVARDGIAFGYSDNKPTAGEAVSRALALCRTAPSTPAAQARCVLVRTYSNECVAVAMDPEAGTPGAGWAIEPTLAEAEQAALDNCKATAGPDRQAYCAPSASYCDHTPDN